MRHIQKIRNVWSDQTPWLRVGLALVLFGLNNYVEAHGGGTNQYGCHNQTSTGTYHCHTGPYNGLSFSNEQAFLNHINQSASNKSPIVSISGGSRTITDTDGKPGEVITLSATATDSDGSVVSTTWLLGGVSVATGTIIELSLSDGASLITFRATDDDGASSTTTVTITVIGSSTTSIPAYNRDDYLPDWGDADGDCINTRHEVLILESVIPVTMSSSGCSVVSGLWNDPFSGLVFSNPSDVDVDHLVALAEVHESGGYLWSIEQKRNYANDILRADALRAIDDGTNSSKSDRDPAEWLPPNAAYHCEYVRDWVEIKNTYGLTFDSAERAAIEAILGADISRGDRPRVTGIRDALNGSSAEFRMGMTKNEECAFTESATTLDVLTITVSITPEQAHLRQLTTIYMVAGVGNDLYSINSQGGLEPFNGQVSNLTPFISSHYFQQSREFTLLNGIVSDPVVVQIYIAYLTTGGEFIYTPTPFSLEIIE